MAGKTFKEDPIGVMAQVIADQNTGRMDDKVFDQAVNGPQGYPDFSKTFKVNPAGFDAFLEHSPESANIEDRRGETVDEFIKRTIEAHAK